MKHTIRIFIITALILIVACDNDARFFGFKYDAEGVARTVPLTGRLYDNISGELIQAELSVDINGQMRTVRDGDFSIDYILQSDEEFNKPIDLTVTSDIYFTWDSSIVVFPDNNEFEATLTYAAPIIETARAVLMFGADVTTTIFDYQGVEDIDSVIFVGTYVFDYGDEITLAKHNTPMVHTANVDANSASYRTQIPTPADAIALDANWFEIRAVDKSGFSTQMAFLYIQGGDTLK